MSSGATTSPRGCASAASTDRLTAVLTRATSLGRTAIVVFEARGRSAGTGDGIGASCVSTGCEPPLSMLSAPHCVTTTSPALAGAGVAGVDDVCVVLDVSVDVVVPVAVGAEPELLPCVSTGAGGSGIFTSVPALPCAALTSTVPSQRSVLPAASSPKQPSPPR